MTTNEHTAKCLHCGRIRRFRSAEAAAHAKPYGRICGSRVRRLITLAEAVKGFAVAQVAKAKELISDGGLIPTARKGVFRAVSSRGDETYLTTAEGNCNCPRGRHVTSATERPCYHVLAARLVLAA
jgi:hypothetical protein